MLTDIRTSKNKLVGRLDKQTYTLQIKDGTKMTLIQVPPNGLSLQITIGINAPEIVCIPPQR